MSCAHTDLLVLANELKAGATEAHWRSAISRGYYAAYHGCKLWHGALNMPGSNEGPPGGSHQQLINKLAHPAPEVKGPEKTLSKTLSLYLRLLHIKRCAADYDLGNPVDQVAAQTACNEAQVILGKI